MTIVAFPLSPAHAPPLDAMPLRQAPEPLLVELGRGGATVIYRRRHTAHGYVDARVQTHEGSEEVRAALDAGCALIDTRPMSFGAVTEWAIKGPLLDVSGDDQPDAVFGAPTPGLGLDGCGYNSFARAPLAVVARLAEARGAFVRNVEDL